MGLTQSELGRMIGLGEGRQSTMAKLEAGQRPLRLNEVEALAGALRVPLAVLVERAPGEEAASAGLELERAQIAFEEVKYRELELLSELDRTRVELGRQEVELRRAEARLAEVAEQERRDLVEHREEA